MCQLLLEFHTEVLGSNAAFVMLRGNYLLQLLEWPRTEEESGLLRMKARLKKDGTVGWVTTKGNQGTAYAEDTSRHYVCRQKAAVEGKFATGSPVLRTLEPGEVFEIIEGPKTESKEGANRVKCRNLGSGKEGWFTLTAKNTHPWSSQYKCTQGTTMTEGLEIKDAKTVRKLEVNELITALETPLRENAAGIMRVRVRAEKDGAIGFATIRGNQGTLLLKPMLG